MTSKCVCLLMTSSKSCSFGNEQTGTGRFGPDSLNRFRLCAISVLVVRRRFQPDLNQTHGQDNLRLWQGGMCLGNMVESMVG